VLCGVVCRTRGGARKRGPTIYIVIWPLRSGLFRVRVHPRGLQAHPSLDAKLAVSGAFFEAGTGFWGSSPSGSAPAGGGPGLGGASRKPHHHSSVSSSSGSNLGMGAAGAGATGGAAGTLDDSKLRDAPTLTTRNPRITRNGLTPFWVRSVPAATAQQGMCSSLFSRVLLSVCWFVCPFVWLLSHFLSFCDVNTVFEEWRESVTNEKPVVGPILTDMLVNAGMALLDPLSASLCSYNNNLTFLLFCVVLCGVQLRCVITCVRRASPPRVC
jgi:hypothetical protein